MPPPKKEGLIKGLLTIDFPQWGLIRALFLGGVGFGGVPLDSHAK